MRFAIKDIGAAGLVTDQEGYELPPNALTTANNVRMAGGWAERIGGHEMVFTATAVVPYQLFAYSNATTDYVIHAGLTAAYVDDGTTRTNISPTPAPAATSANRITGGTLNGVQVLNNQADAPWYWNGSVASDFTALPGWTSTHRCKALRPFKNQLIAINLTKGAASYPHMVKWSHTADPGAVPSSWDETDPALDAGEVDLAETPDPLVDGLPLGDQFIVYGHRSAYSMTYIGAPLIYRFQRLPGEYGMLAQNCVAQVPMGHVVLTPGDVIVHSGSFPRSILDGRAREWLFGQMNSTTYSAAFLAHNPIKQEVWICIPASGERFCTKALVWNYAQDALSTRDLPNLTSATPAVVNYSNSAFAFSGVVGTFASITGTFADYDSFSAREARLVLSSYDSEIYIADSGNLADGAAFTATIERTGLDMGAPDRRKLIREVWPLIDGTAGTQVTVQVGASENPTSAPTWNAAQNFTIGTSNKVDALVSGRYMSYRITSTGADPWRIRSLLFNGAAIGKY